MLPLADGARPSPLRRGIGWGTAVIGFATLAPLASAAVPLAALLWMSKPRTNREVIAVALATGVGLWWLIQSGSLPDQFLRATVVLATSAFVVLTWRTALSFLHRALAAAAFGTVTASVMLPVLGSSWSELRWWVEFQHGTAYRDMIGVLAAIAGNSAADLNELGARLASTARLMGEFAVGLSVLQVVAGLTLAYAMYRYVATVPRGVVPARFRDLRFSEHLGWAAVLSLVIVVLPKVVSIKLAAANVLLVAGVLYGLRGAAVALFGLHMLVGSGGLLFWTFAVFVTLLILPVVVGSAILLGVIDAGVNLRGRWSAAAGR
jgi:hypothetical protein